VQGRQAPPLAASPASGEKLRPHAQRRSQLAAVHRTAPPLRAGAGRTRCGEHQPCMGIVAAQQSVGCGSRGAAHVMAQGELFDCLHAPLAATYPAAHTPSRRLTRVVSLMTCYNESCNGSLVTCLNPKAACHRRQAADASPALTAGRRGTTQNERSETQQNQTPLWNTHTHTTPHTK